LREAGLTVHVTQLAHGKITNADTLTIELVAAPDLPPVIRLRGVALGTLDLHTSHLRQGDHRCNAGFGGSGYRVGGAPDLAAVVNLNSAERAKEIPAGLLAAPARLRTYSAVFVH
jgi:hypothetical protein